MARRNANRGTKQRQAERRIQVWTLIKQGKSYRATAQIVGCSLATVQEDLKATMTEMREVQEHERNLARTLELERLNDLFAATFPRATGTNPCPHCGLTVDSDLGAVAATVRIMERRAKYQGLDKEQAYAVREATNVELQKITNDLLTTFQWAIGSQLLTEDAANTIWEHLRASVDVRSVAPRSVGL